MGYSTIYMGTVTQVYSLSLAGGHPRVKLWFDGNGQDTYHIDSAYIEQGVKTVNVCAGFYVPRNGRWSDWIDISSLTLPATVTLYITLSVPANIPINSGTNSPVAGAVPEVIAPVITPSTSPITSDPTYESAVPAGYSHKGWCSFASSDDGATLIACTSAQAIFDGDGYVLGCTGTGKVFISRDSGAVWTDVTPSDWFGYLPKVCCDSTGEKIAITSLPMDFLPTAYVTKSDFNKFVAKYDGCIMTSVDGGSNWTARWPGYGANPGVWNSTTNLTIAAGNQLSFTIASALNLSFYGSVSKAQYKLKIYGYDGSDVRGVSAEATFVSYIGSTLKLAITSINGAYNTSYGDWLIYFDTRYRYTSIDMSEDGQTIVAGMQNYNGEHGAFVSKDGGATWSKLNFLVGEADYSNSTYYPYGAVSYDGQKIVFSSEDGMLFYSTDGGTTVNFTSEEANSYKTQICGDGTTAFNLNAYALYQSTDGLANWVAVNAPATPSYVLDYSVSEDGNTICEFYLDVAALSRSVGVSIDSGTTWTTLLSRPIDDIESPGIFTMFSVAISPDGDTVVVGESKPDATYDNIYIFKAPYTSPTETVIDPVIEMDTMVITNTGTITVSNNSLVLENETITIDGVVYTFKSTPTGLDNEIIIGLTDDLTAANIASVLSVVAGDLISATVSEEVVSVSFLSPDTITWSTTSSGITLNPASTMTQTTTYTSASAPASLPCLTVSGSIAIPASLPLLSAAGKASVLPYGVGTLPLLWVNKSMSHQSITCNVSSTDAVKISLLEAGNDFLESLVTGLFDHADDDSFALQVTQWVADNITYLADSVDTWNNATKTLFDGYGDCEDGAILLASLLINGGVDAAKVRVYIGTYTVNETSTGHAWVEYFRDSDHQWVTLDWTMGTTYWYGIYQLSTLSKTYPDMTQTYTTATEYITSTNVVALADTEAYVISLQITSMAGTFPLLTVTGADQNKGTMAGSLKALTAHGTTGNFGNLTKSMPALISSGFVGSVRASLSSALPVFTISATGINANRVTLSSSLPAIRMAGEAYQLNYGTVSASLPKPVCSASGYPIIKMVAALELPMLKMAGAGRTSRDFDDFVVKHEYDSWAYANADLPLLTISAGGS